VVETIIIQINVVHRFISMVMRCIKIYLCDFINKLDLYYTDSIQMATINRFVQEIIMKDNRIKDYRKVYYKYILNDFKQKKRK
jgi:hypothetical protein